MALGRRRGGSNALGVFLTSLKWRRVALGLALLLVGISLVDVHVLSRVCRAAGDTGPAGPAFTCDALIQAAATLVAALAAIGAVLWAFTLEEGRARALREREVGSFVRKIEGLLERMPKEDRGDPLSVSSTDLQDLARLITQGDMRWSRKLPMPGDIVGTADYLIRAGDSVNVRFEVWERDRVTPEVVALCELPDEQLKGVQAKLLQLYDAWDSLPKGSDQAADDDRVYELLRVPYRETPLIEWSEERARMREVERALLEGGPWASRAVLILRIVWDILSLRRDLVLAYSRLLELHVGDLREVMDLTDLDARLNGLARWRIDAGEIDRLYPKFRLSLLYAALHLDLPSAKARELL